MPMAIMCHWQLDMPTARYAFAFLAKGEICQKRGGIYLISIRGFAEYISQNANISNSSFVNIFHESEYIDRRKNKSKNRRKLILLLLLFSACYKVLGLAHSAFVRTNAMLAFSRVFKFSAKNITPISICFFFFYLFFMWSYAWSFFAFFVSIGNG